MKTTTTEINDELTQMLLNLVDAGLKHPELGGARLGVQGALCLQWLQTVQQALNEQGNGAMPVDSDLEDEKTQEETH